MCASSPRRTSGSRTRSPPAVSAKTSTTASTSCRFRSPRSGSGGGASRSSSSTFSGCSPAAPGGLGGLEESGTFEEFKLAAERAFLLVKLRQHDWNVAETARVLAMPRSNLYKKIERHRLAREHE